MKGVKNHPRKVIPLQGQSPRNLSFSLNALHGVGVGVGVGVIVTSGSGVSYGFSGKPSISICQAASNWSAALRGEPGKFA